MIGRQRGRGSFRHLPGGVRLHVGAQAISHAKRATLSLYQAVVKPAVSDGTACDRRGGDAMSARESLDHRDELLVGHAH